MDNEVEFEGVFDDKLKELSEEHILSLREYGQVINEEIKNNNLFDINSEIERIKQVRDAHICLHDFDGFELENARLSMIEWKRLFLSKNDN